MVLSVVSRPSEAGAAPQWHGAVAGGVCSIELDSGVQFPRFCGALKSELLLGRERDSDFGFGPLLHLGSAHFDHYTASAGVSALLPVSPTYPAIVSLSGGALRSESRWAPVLEGWLFWGPSSYNFHSHYAMASGFLFGAQLGLGSRRFGTLSLALQLDLQWLAIPFIAAHQWVFAGDR
jgi:hypothetical protein